MIAENHIGEGPSIRAGHRSHTLAPALSRTVSWIVGGGNQLPGKAPNQRLIGGDVDVNLLLRQANREIGRVGGKLAARRLGSGGDFLLRGFYDSPRLFLSRRLNALLLGSRFFLRGVAHHADVYIQ